MGIDLGISLVFFSPPTNNDTLKPLCIKPFNLLIINVSENPGNAGNIKPIFNPCDIKMQNHVEGLNLMTSGKIDYI